jgi:hypothetical protein
MMSPVIALYALMKPPESGSPAAFAIVPFTVVPLPRATL